MLGCHEAGLLAAHVNRAVAHRVLVKSACPVLTVRERGAELILQLNRDAAGQKARLDELVRTLPEGESRRGQTVWSRMILMSSRWRSACRHLILSTTE